VSHALERQIADLPQLLNCQGIGVFGGRLLKAGGIG
jgi:hypothetical protein